MVRIPILRQKSKSEMDENKIVSFGSFTDRSLNLSSGSMASTTSLKSSEDLSLLNWNLIQSHILTGGGKLDRFSVPDTDFLKNDLPHYHLTNKSTRKQFKLWKKDQRTSSDIIGAWSRPLFSGGWTESTHNDTSAFNLQTPSIFIDMRFPNARPDHVLKRRHHLNECSNIELRILARQHCFGGYSYPSLKFRNRPKIPSKNIRPSRMRIKFLFISSDGNVVFHLTTR